MISDVFALRTLFSPGSVSHWHGSPSLGRADINCPDGARDDTGISLLNKVESSAQTTEQQTWFSTMMPYSPDAKPVTLKANTVYQLP